MSVTSEALDVIGLGGGDATTVLDRILDELDPVELHAIAITATRGSTHYAVVAKTGRNSGGDVIDLRTVVVDLDDESVRVTDNGMWIPYDPDVVTAVLRSLARTHTDMTGDADDVREPAALSAVSTSATEILSTPVDDEDEHDADGWGVEYGNGQGTIPATYDLVDRLREADVETERFSRIKYGDKTPIDRAADYAASDMMGNYGVETLEDDRLIVVDVDYPDDAPLDQLPETYRVSSPNGSDERAHHYYVLPEGFEKHGIYDYYGSWALKPEWGDVWIAGEYVVGPGSRLDDGGSYDVVDDVPIATIEPSDLMSLVPRSRSNDEPDEDDSAEDDEDELDVDVVDMTDDEPDEDLVVCDVTGKKVPREDATLTDRGDGPVYVADGVDDDTEGDA